MIFHTDPLAYIDRSPDLVAMMLRRAHKFFDETRRED
jgi:hypothetical protein